MALMFYKSSNVSQSEICDNVLGIEADDVLAFDVDAFTTLCGFTENFAVCTNGIGVHPDPSKRDGSILCIFPIIS